MAKIGIATIAAIATSFSDPKNKIEKRSLTHQTLSVIEWYERKCPYGTSFCSLFDLVNNFKVTLGGSSRALKCN